MGAEKPSWALLGEHLTQVEEAKLDTELYLRHRRPWDRLGHILENLVGAFVIGFVMWIVFLCLDTVWSGLGFSAGWLLVFWAIGWLVPTMYQRRFEEGYGQAIRDHKRLTDTIVKHGPSDLHNL